MIIVANWKMHPGTEREALRLFEATKKIVAARKGVTVIVAPPALYIRACAAKRKGLFLAAQNATIEDDGAHTGDISFTQIKDAKATYVILGHAERRACGETDEQIRAKVAGALRAGLVPIVCVGESIRDENGAQFDTVRSQLRAAFAEVPAAKVNSVIIAYEPVWAIGAAKPMNPRDMHEMSIFIRKTLIDLYSGGQKPVKIAPTILYGGAMDASHVKDMHEGGDVSGFLVGRASVDATTFSELIKSI